jgi:hypothetical protein
MLVQFPGDWDIRRFLHPSRRSGNVWTCMAIIRSAAAKSLRIEPSKMP